ncbi:MAG: DUF2127 domain-containing protein [bacterium]
MATFLKQKYWHELFEAGVAFKALNSVWEVLGGVFLLTRLHFWFTHLVVHISNSEFLGEHGDFLSRLLTTQVSHLAADSTRLFVGLYLLFHGLMNAFLAFNLYRNRLWSYPVSIAFTSLFLVYQTYRLFHTHSPLLLFITVLDVFFIILTWHEWQFQKQKVTSKES